MAHSWDYDRGDAPSGPAPRSRQSGRRRKKKSYTFGRNQEVKGGVEQRARQRLGRTGRIKGVNAKDGITGREARKIRRVATREGVLKGGRRNAPQGRRPRQQVDPFRQEINARTRLEFGPQERELQYQRDQSAQFSSNLQQWYGQHVQDLQRSQALYQGYAQGVQAAQLQASQNAAQVDAGQNAQDIAKMQADAQKRGATVDPNLLAQMQQGVAARQQMGNAGAQMLGAQGMAQSGFLANQVNVGSQQGLQAQSDEASRRRRLDQLAADLAADKGAFKVKTRADLQSEQHKQRLENAAFGLDQAELALDAQKEKNDARQAKQKARAERAKRRRENMEADRKYQLDLDKFGADQAKERYQRRHGLGPYKPAAGNGNGKSNVKGDVDNDGIADRGKYRGYSESERDKFDTAINLLRAIDGKKGTGYVSRTRSGALTALIQDKNIPARIARRALRSYLKGTTRNRSVRPQTGTPVG